MNFGNNLIKLRKSKGWSQEDLANELDLSRQAISKWELGTTKPDIDNLMKISKLFSISIDELVNNEIVNSDAVSIEVKKKDKKHEIFVWIRRFIIVLAIIYAIDVIYKFSVLFTIAKAQEKYKNLNNYHYVITTYDNEGLKEKEECWFKDGVSKTINTLYDKEILSEKITFIDYNNNKGFIKEKNLNQLLTIDKSNTLMENYKNGEQLYLKFPSKIINTNFKKIISNVIKNKNIKVNFLEKTIFINLKNNYIALDNESLLPVSFQYEDFPTEKFVTRYYFIELNSVDDIKI